MTVANQGLFIGIPGCLKTCHVILVGDWHPGWGGFQQLEVECMACSQGHSEVIPLGGGWGVVSGWTWCDWLVIGDELNISIHLASLLIKRYYQGGGRH